MSEWSNKLFSPFWKACCTWTIWACLLCLPVLSRGQCVCVCSCTDVNACISFKCYLLRGEEKSAWAPVGRLGAGQRSLLPVRRTLLSSKSRDRQLGGLAHKPVCLDLCWAGGRHIDFPLFLARPTHSITSERAPLLSIISTGLTNHWSPEKFHLAGCFSWIKQKELSVPLVFWIKLKYYLLRGPIVLSMVTMHN